MRDNRLRPEGPIPALERGDRRGRGQDVNDGLRFKRLRLAVAGEAPRQKGARAHSVGSSITRDDRPVRQLAEPRPPQAFAPVLDPLAVERFVHRLHAPRRAGESGDKGFRGLPPALEAWAVAGGERGRLVEKEELRVVAPPDVAMATLECANADEPVLGLPAAAAQRLINAMQPPAAIAHQSAALGDGVQFAERIDAILQRAESLRHTGRLSAASRESR
jgi:hypothetical protein